MPKQVLLIHPWGGKHPQHWLSWLEEQLREKRFETFYPDLPNPDTPNIQEWLGELKKVPVTFNESLVLVGHSLGCPTILHILQNLKEGEKVGLVVLVAGFARDLGIPEVKNFVEKSFDWEKIHSKANKFVVIFSDNDPYIPVPESDFLAKQLKITPVLESQADHIRAPDFGPYPRVLKLILEESNEK
ncbi:alpha/beta hydrolase [Candidatus Micrarchaeota archaeon]|nr:alpha/beta hydrolase [Candidatus Micrarchaeota archaeon]MBU1930867.1 alpha/beta hydrolase [Candidatus Micrarchaeota archaeon]